LTLALSNSWADEAPVKDDDKLEKCVDMPLQRHLLKFLEMFGRNFNQQQFALSIRAGGFLFQRELTAEFESARGRAPQATRLNVESPLDPTEDVATGAFNYLSVKNHFRQAYDLLYAQGPFAKSMLCLIVDDKHFNLLTQTARQT